MPPSLSPFFLSKRQPPGTIHVCFCSSFFFLSYLEPAPSFASLGVSRRWARRRYVSSLSFLQLGSAPGLPSFGKFRFHLLSLFRIRPSVFLIGTLTNVHIAMFPFFPGPCDADLCFYTLNASLFDFPDLFFRSSPVEPMPLCSSN